MKWSRSAVNWSLFRKKDDGSWTDAGQKREAGRSEDDDSVFSVVIFFVIILGVAKRTIRLTKQFSLAEVGLSN